MSNFVSGIVDIGSDIIGGITGSTAADAAEGAAETQSEAGLAAIEAQKLAARKGDKFLRPFAQLGRQGIQQAGFLTDPQAQFDFLQSNPLFQLGLDNANQQTQKSAASRGRLSAGDTLEQLSNNVLLQAQPLIAQQGANIRGLINTGAGIAGSRANIQQGLGAGTSGLLTDIGAAQAAGQVGAANATGQFGQSLLGAGTGAALGQAGLLGGAGAGLGALIGLSDERLKRNKRVIGRHKGHVVWSWTWNELAKKTFNLSGESIGVMAQTLKLTNPSAVSEGADGFLRINYGAL